MHSWRLLAAIGLLAVLVGTIAVTAQPRVDPNVRTLVDRLEGIDKLLLEADWARARRQGDALIRDLTSELVDRGSALIGAALAQVGRHAFQEEACGVLFELARQSGVVVEKPEQGLEQGSREVREGGEPGPHVTESTLEQRRRQSVSIVEVAGDHRRRDLRPAGDRA